MIKVLFLWFVKVVIAVIVTYIDVWIINTLSSEPLDLNMFHYYVLFALNMLGIKVTEGYD